MFPTANQYRKWSMPSKWSFWAAMIGIPVSIWSLLLTNPLPPTVNPKEERIRLLLRTAQELRYNNEWLASVATAHYRRSKIPVGTLKSDALLLLMEREYAWLTRGAYGEEKNLYQLALRLKDLSFALGSPSSSSQVIAFNRKSEFTLHDIHFLNNFLLWYLRPHIVDELDSKQLYSLGFAGLPGDRFRIEGVKTPSFRYFVLEGKSITEFSEYLALID